MKDKDPSKVPIKDISKKGLDPKYSDFASAIIDNTSDAITVINLKGEILFWNNGASELSGYSNEDVLGKHISLVYRKQDLPELIERINKAIKGEYFANKELILLDKNKKEHTVLLTLNGLKDETGEVTQLVGFTKDISEQKQAENEFRESKKEHKNLITKMMNAFALHEIIYNAEGDAIDYKFLQVNPAWEKIVGTKSEMVVGKTVREIIPDIEDIWIERYNKIVETGIPEEFEEYSVALRKYFYCYAYRTGPRKFAVIFNDTTEKKQAEIELIKAKENAVISENYLDSIINNIGDPFFVKDEQSRILLVNDAFCALFDLTRDHILGKTLAEDVSPDERESFLRIDKQVLKTGQENIIEESLTVRGGPTKTISTRKTRYIDSNDDKYLIGVIRDITERKIAEEQLKETLSQNELAVDISKLGVWQLNIDSGELLWNDRHLEIYGITREEFNNDLEGWRNQLHPEDKNYADSHFQEVFERKSIHKMNFRIIRPNGDIRYLSASATPIVINDELVKIIGVNQDITESKNLEKELKESEGRIRLFTQSVPDFLLQIDRTGKINYINKTLEGLTQKDVIGSSVYSWIPEGFLERFKDKVGKVFSDGGNEIMEYPTKGVNDESQWFESQMGPLEKSGIITQVIIVSRDITERKTAELELKRVSSENIELKQQIEAENIYLKEELKLESSYNEIVGSSKSLRKVLKQVEQVAHTDSTVLILGETGTGKELIARAIHNASDRKAKPIVKVNCSALPGNLIESELFGHEKGAFTGAINRKIGRFELANGGTIFLDEIGDLPIGLQTRLLRVLQESEFERVGGEKTIKIDVRVITATNRNLAKQVLENKFRQDLYYRLNVFPITCPPLRNRIDDIQSLVHHFVNKYNPKVNNKIKTVHQKTIKRLMDYNWPGNIRELENVIERAVILNQGGQLRLGKWFMDSSIDTIVHDDLKTMETVERDYIIKVLEKTNWKIRGKNGAAEILGMQPTTLESRMKKRAIKR